MKKALILDLRICEVRDQPFPVAAPLRWVDCANDVTPETHTFDGAIFAPRPIPVPPAQDDLAARAVDGVDRLQFDVLFNHENRIRALEVLTDPTKTPITRAQFRDALITRWKALNP